jgi:very-short-patch-repair endonuclease
MRQREVGSRGELKRLIDVRVRAREMRKTPTPAELVLWATLRDRKILDRKFRRQFALDCFILDFYCQELKLVIEVDGGIHSEPGQAAHDENRDDYLRSLGCTILRFPNEVVLLGLKTVVLKIADAIDTLTLKQ